VQDGPVNQCVLYNVRIRATFTTNRLLLLGQPDAIKLPIKVEIKGTKEVDYY